MTGGFSPDFATAHLSTEHTAAETRDVAGNLGPFRGAHGEAAGTRSGGNVLRRLHASETERGNAFPIGYLKTVIAGETQAWSGGAGTAWNAHGIAASELKAITDRPGPGIGGGRPACVILDWMDSERLGDAQIATSVFEGAGKACRPLGVVIKGVVKPLGSCVLFEVGDALFLATASHVVDGYVGVQTLVVATSGGRYAGVSGTIMGSQPASLHSLDFAVILCDEVSRHSLVGTNRLAAGELAILDDAAQTQDAKYVIHGYPLSKVSRPAPKKKSYEPFILPTFAAPARIYRKLDINEHSHVVVAHDANTSTNTLGHRAPSVKGVSGGALWRVGDPAGASGHGTRLVGIAVEHYKKLNAIVAVRIGVITEMIRANAPRLVEGLPSPRFTLQKIE